MQENVERPTESGPQRGRLRGLAGVLAVLLALGVVAGLLYLRFGPQAAGEQTHAQGAAGGVDLDCRLPVLAGSFAGFITFPAGNLTLDRTANLNPKGGGATYDAQLRKWVPVPRSALSPDGRSYTYLAQTTGVPGQPLSWGLHVHEILSGNDRVLWSGSDLDPVGGVATWLAAGIYFTAESALSAGPKHPGFPAVYVADPNRPASPRRVGPNPEPQPPEPGQLAPSMWMLFGTEAAWGTSNVVPAAGPAPGAPVASMSYGPTRILRMNLRDGSLSTWYTASGGTMVSLFALDGEGRPIISLFQPPTSDAAPPDGFQPPPPHLQLLSGPDQVDEITSGNPDLLYGGPPWPDSHGLWFGGLNSVWLYSPKDGFRRVATIPAGGVPTPTPGPGYAQKGTPPTGASPAPPPYGQGTLVAPAGSCT